MKYKVVLQQPDEGVRTLQRGGASTRPSFSRSRRHVGAVQQALEADKPRRMLALRARIEVRPACSAAGRSLSARFFELRRTDE